MLFVFIVMLKIRIIIVLSLALLLLISATWAQQPEDKAPYAVSTVSFEPMDLQWDMIFWFSGEQMSPPDNQLLGVEYANNQFFVTGGGGTVGGRANMTWIYNFSGVLIDSFLQWSAAGWGWRDLAYDGQYLYGADDFTVDAFDPLTYASVPASNINVIAPPAFPRALAYDDVNDVFWAGNFSSNIYSFTRAGVVTDHGSCGLTGVYGAAWDNGASDGPWLWLHDQSGDSASHRTTIYQYDPVGDSLTGVSYQVPIIGGGTLQVAGGLAFTDELDPNYFTMIGLAQRDPADAVFVLEMYPQVEEMDMGDLWACDYPTLLCNPSHDLSNIAWLGQGITGEPAPNILDLDPMDDGVVYHLLPWMPCTMQAVTVTVTGGINYAMFEYMGGHLYLNGWKDGNLDFDFCDTLCIDPTGVGVDEWIVQDVMVWPGVFNFNFLDPGVLNMGHYDGVFRWRLTSQPIGRQGFGLIDTTHCPNMVCGTFAHDTVGEVEDYVIPFGQLPVELVSFEATPGDGRVTLNWSTASETDNDHFVLYRRVAGSTVFDRYTQIDGSGTTTTQRDYTYIDNAVVNGVTYEYQLADVDINGVETVHEMIVEATPFAGAEVPTEYALHQNYPNPFNSTTMFRFDIKETGQVTLRIFDLMGREVATLVNDERSAGFHTISWDASELATGIYFYRLEVNGFTDVKKMLFLK